MAGKFFDEWEVGETITHEIRRTVTETDNLLISTLTHNPQPLHLDHEAAKDTEFGKPLVNSCFTFSLIVGVSVGDTTLGTLVANLGYDQVKFPAPVFVGDDHQVVAVSVEGQYLRHRAFSPSRFQRIRRAVFALVMWRNVFGQMPDVNRKTGYCPI